MNSNSMPMAVVIVRTQSRILIFSLEPEDTDETLFRKGEKQMAKNNPLEPAEKTVVIIRVFDAIREMVWKAWTDPERLKRWWGPRGFTAPYAKIDLRVGGKYLNCMRSPDGKDFWSTGVYNQIIPLQRFVVTDSFADKDGNVVPATYYGMNSTFPMETQITVTFEDQTGKTKMTLKYASTKMLSDEDRKNMIQGWNESFDKLAELLQKSKAIHAQM